MSTHLTTTPFIADGILEILRLFPTGEIKRHEIRRTIRRDPNTLLQRAIRRGWVIRTRYAYYQITTAGIMARELGEYERRSPAAKRAESADTTHAQHDANGRETQGKRSGNTQGNAEETPRTRGGNDPANTNDGSCADLIADLKADKDPDPLLYRTPVSLSPEHYFPNVQLFTSDLVILSLAPDQRLELTTYQWRQLSETLRNFRDLPEGYSGIIPRYPSDEEEGLN